MDSIDAIRQAMSEEQVPPQEEVGKEDSLEDVQETQDHVEEVAPTQEQPPQQLSVVEQTTSLSTETKSIGKLTSDDIYVTLDHTKSLEEQAHDYVFTKATVAAIQDQDTQEALASAERDVLIGQATKKLKSAEKQVLEVETEIQKAQAESFEGILSTFGFFQHYPRWMTKIIVLVLTPFLMTIGFVIGIPCGFVKILMENIESIVCRYEKATDTVRPKIKVTVWILLVLLSITALCLTLLKCFNVI